MKYNCELIQDLLPTYHDKALSEVSNTIVEEHIETCPLCKQYSEDIYSSKEQTLESISPPSINTSTFSKQVKRVRKIILTAFIVIALSLTAAVGFIIYLNFSETPSHTFTTYSEALDLIERGWIPSNIPTDTTNIHVIYNIDSNVINGSFDLSESATDTFLNTCTATSFEQFNELPHSLDYEWADNKNLISINDPTVADYTLLENDSFLFALSPSGYVLFWSK